MFIVEHLSTCIFYLVFDKHCPHPSIRASTSREQESIALFSRSQLSFVIEHVTTWSSEAWWLEYLPLLNRFFSSMQIIFIVIDRRSSIMKCKKCLVPSCFVCIRLVLVSFNDGIKLCKWTIRAHSLETSACFYIRSSIFRQAIVVVVVITLLPLAMPARIIDVVFFCL